MEFSISVLYLLIGIGLGMFILFIITPPAKIMMKYPTLENIKNTTYVDDNGTCYRYEIEETECPIDLNLANQNQNKEPFIVLS
jgi:hypothetical protein